MLRTKNIYAQICNSTKAGHQLSDDQLLQLQAHLMGMYKDIQEVCDRHGLQMSLAYGNVIGVMRHGGWIPWDDDLDIMMPRSDYDRLLTEFADELPEKYKVYSVYTPEGPYERFAKIVDTTTEYAEIMGTYHHHEGVFVDIFPIDNFNPAKRFLKLRKYWMMFMMYTATSVKQYLVNNDFYKRLMYSSDEGRRNYQIRNLWGMAFSFIKPEKWYKWIDSMSKEKKHTGLLHVPIGQILFFDGKDENIFFPPSKVKISDGTIVNLPHKPTEYLDLIYKNWREIPNDSDRWHHFVRRFNLEKPSDNPTLK